jgi:hypothetical protein
MYFYVEKETLVANPNDLGFGTICGLAHLFSGIGDRTIHLRVILMLLMFSLSTYSVSIFSTGGRFG